MGEFSAISCWSSVTADTHGMDTGKEFPCPPAFVRRDRMWLVCAIIMVVLSFCSVAEGGTGAYGKPVKYALNMEIKYPAFTVRFIGTRRESSTAYPRGFLYHDFEVLSRMGNKVHVSWTSGTGVLGPNEFSVDGRKYFLELKANSLEEDPKQRWLKEDELIIWQEEVYLEKQQVLHRRRNERIGQ